MKAIRLSAFFVSLVFCISLFSDLAWGAVSFGPPSGLLHRSKAVSPPAAVIDDSGRIYIAWLEEEKDVNSLYLAASEDNGKTFKEIKVNAAEDEPASIHESPAIALGKNGEVYIVWTSRNAAGGFSADLRIAVSTDSGKSFGASRKIDNNTKPASIGFDSIAIGPDGTVYVAWLDGREKETKGSGTYIAHSKDNGKSFSKNVRIDSNSCPCCRTAVAVGGDGTVYVAWRKVFEKNVREMVVARSDDGGLTFKPPAIVGPDNWEIAGCPHRGPSMKADEKGGLYIVWYAEVEGEPNIYLAKSDDKGASFKKQAIDHKRSAFPDNAVLNLRRDEIFLAWQEITPVLSNLAFESRGAEGKSRVQMNDDTRKASNPVISVNRRGEVLVAWLKQEVGKVRTVIRIGK